MQRNSSKAGKRLLVLGGTRFVGRGIVLEGLARGYEVCVFHRGQSPGELPAAVERRFGDRDLGELGSLATGEWDLVVDASGYVPQQVRQSAELLRGRVGCYVFVSTCSVYAAGAGDLVGENSELHAMQPGDPAPRTIEEAIGESYGALKAACEREAEAALPGQVFCPRPGLVVGPGDLTDRFTYWPLRAARGGLILAPGPPTTEVQFIDVRDLAAWVLDGAEKGLRGAYTSIGMGAALTFGELLSTCLRAAAPPGTSGAEDSRARVHWAASAELEALEVRPWMELPLWLPKGWPRFDNRRALAAGLQLRPIHETVADTLAWARESLGDDYGWTRGAGMSASREAELLARLLRPQG